MRMLHATVFADIIGEGEALGAALLLGVAVLAGAVITASTALINGFRPFAIASLVLAMLPICGCGFGLWHRPDEYRPWFALVWLLQFAIIATVLISLRFRMVAVIAFVLALGLALWLVTGPVESWFREDHMRRLQGGPWVQDPIIRGFAF